ncbi:ABC-type phosphate/phosphonate transport system, periplasmic component [Candidatus Desulfosporosinus infrequens]|uniref:ABC-type phosphate/phosphonate transport system, periplasmic component n=1 Tax=Candidatus Desulfosporosinus infrequens TaxID=2043169 RepID=A0A2U3KWR3_9FIRM|nr:ABC-type phosphate/phosphonate transport system, periplasmic component [Candidatus Desulfosporosinus infrequens]
MLRKTRVLTIILTLIIVLFASGCQVTAPVKIDLQKTVSAEQLQDMVKTKADYYYVGFDWRLGPSEDVKRFIPLLNYLERQTGYKFRLRVFPQDVDIAREMGAGQIQFSIIGPLSVLRAEKYGVKSLVIGITENGTSNYRTMIVTQPGSPIKTIQDLRGRTLAFSAKTSTQGYLIPRIMLAQAKLNLSDLASFESFQSYADAANAVLGGRFEAAALQDTLAEKLSSEGLVKIVASSDYYPSGGVSVASGIDPAVVVAVQKALLEFAPQGKDQGGLYQWNNSEMPKGFDTIQGDPYAVFRTWAQNFGLLN